ncbi:MAG: hypothetical protein IKQ97_10935 [Eubacterium sp.]|nr:hypothetical protein [Eubacterium sp.]
MDDKIFPEKQDFTHLIWSRFRHSSGTAGSYLKAYEEQDGIRTYYKLSAYDRVRGIYGHECVNELIVDRLLTLLGFEHVPYRLIHADVLIDDTPYDTWLCASENFRRTGEKKMAFDVFFEREKEKKETPLMFCERMGWQTRVDEMLLVDYLILNRDRHGANIEVLKDSDSRNVRLAPLYDHGVSLLFSCITEEEVVSFDVMEDRRIQSFVGSGSASENLRLICDNPVKKPLKKEDQAYLLDGLDEVIPAFLQEAIWEMIWKRWVTYENLSNS